MRATWRVSYLGALGAALSAMSCTDERSLPLRVGSAADPLTWTEQAELAASDGGPYLWFGNSVAVSGDTAVIGTCPVTGGVGSAYVFVRSGPSWTPQQGLPSNDSAPGFGCSVAVNGDTAVVGASATGVASVFVQSGVVWSWQQDLSPDNGTAGDRFGASVAVGGDTVVVGASGTGTAYVFVRSGSSWSQQWQLTSSDGATNNQFIMFGASTAVSGDTAVVGTYPTALFTGAAYVFVRSGTSWSQQQSLIPDAGPPGDYGCSVAVDQDTTVVGARESATGPGAAYVFVRSGTSWSQQQVLLATNGMLDGALGDSVAVSGDLVVAGAVGEGQQGAAYVFSRAGTVWSQQQELTPSDGTLGETFGWSVTVSGDTAIVGAPQSPEGSAYAFVLAGASCSQATDCGTGFCVSGVCCAEAMCTALDDCHDVGLCPLGTGVCTNPTKADGAMCANGTCHAGVCTPASDAGPDGGSVGTGGGPSTETTAVGGATGGANGTGGETSEATIDLSCRAGAPRPRAVTKAVWVGAIASLAWRRRRRCRPRSTPPSKGRGASR